MLKGMENWNMKAKVQDIFEMANVLKFSYFNFTPRILHGDAHRFTELCFDLEET